MYIILVLDEIDVCVPEHGDCDGPGSMLAALCFLSEWTTYVPINSIWLRSFDFF